MPPADAYWEQLRRTGLEAGLLDLGVAPAAPMERARAEIESRLAEGFDGGMQFTFRNPLRSTSPSMAVAGARSMIVGLLSYADVPDAGPRPRHGRVARYARVDSYGRLKECLMPIRDRLRRDGHRAVIFSDDNSLVDREAAWLAGLGWYGKNANLLANGAGSFVVIGSVITTAELPHSEPVPDGCGSCSRCLPACPTGAIVRPGVIDARRCLTWVLQRPGVIERRWRTAIADRIYGCDDCQTSCPPTVRMARSASAGGLTGAGHDIDLLWLLAATDDEVLARCDPWYIHGRDPRWLRRNAVVVLGNVGDPRDPEVVAAIERAVGSGDPVLRGHGAWAAARLGLWESVGRRLDAESDPEVLAELVDLPACRDDL